MTGDLAGRITAALARPVVPEVRDFARKLAEAANARKLLIVTDTTRSLAGCPKAAPRR